MNYQIHSSVTRQGGVLQSTDKPFSATATRSEPKRRKTEPDQETKGKATRNANRSVNALVQELQRIKPAPHYFLSLIIDRRSTPKEEAGFLKKAVSDFVRRVEYRYPSAYFISVLGWSDDTDAVHAHIVTDLGQVRPRRWFATEQKLRKLWMDVIGSTNTKTLKMTEYEQEFHVSYLSNDEKRHEAVVLRHRLEKGKIWTIVNKKYIRQAKLDTLMFRDAIEREQFEQILIGLMREANVHRSNFGRIQRLNNCNNYLTEDLLQRAFAEFRAWRAAW